MTIHRLGARQEITIDSFALAFAFSPSQNETIIATLLHDLLSILITGEYMLKLLPYSLLPAH